SGESVMYAPSARRALAGLSLSGLLAALLGAILPAWGYHQKFEFATVGYHFLSVTVGVLISVEASRRLLPRKGVACVLILACSLACAGVVFRALSRTPRPTFCGA